MCVNMKRIMVSPSQHNTESRVHTLWSQFIYMHFPFPHSITRNNVHTISTQKSKNTHMNDHNSVAIAICLYDDPSPVVSFSDQ